jgi:hypothetical protein
MLRDVLNTARVDACRTRRRKTRGEIEENALTRWSRDRKRPVWQPAARRRRGTLLRLGPFRARVTPLALCTLWRPRTRPAHNLLASDGPWHEGLRRARVPEREREAWAGLV